MRSAFAIVAGLMLCGPAAAQAPSSDTVNTVAGNWEISNADRDKTCPATLKPEPAPGGLKIELDRSCLDALPMTKDIVAWTIGSKDEIRLIDQRGRTVFEFSEVESGMYEGERRGEGVYFMQSLASLAGEVRTADSMFGEWGLVRGSGKPVCLVTLANAGATGAMSDAFMLQLKPGCDATVTRFGPTAWRLDRGELLLVSARGVWRFEEVDQATWQRVPQSSGWQLVKQ